VNISFLIVQTEACRKGRKEFGVKRAAFDRVLATRLEVALLNVAAIDATNDDCESTVHAPRKQFTGSRLFGAFDD